MATSSSIFERIRDHFAWAVARSLVTFIWSGSGQPARLEKDGDRATLFLRAPGVHILSVERRLADLPFARVSRRDMAPPVHDFVPTLARIAYLVETRTPAVALQVDVLGLDKIACRPARIADLPRLFTQLWQKPELGLSFGEGVFILPLLRGGGEDARALSRSLRRLDQFGFGPGGRNLRETLHRDCEDEGRAKTAIAAGADETRIGFHLHLHYPELWPEFETALLRVKRPFRLIVTLTSGHRELRDRIAAAFAGASVLTVENRGRDVGPFLQLWRDGHFGGLDLVCKIHGKRTGASGSTALLGAIWRRAMIQDLMGSNAIVNANIAMFSDPRLGMVGSGRVRLPNSCVSERSAWGMNKDTILALARRIGADAQGYSLDFFAGTMFWLRPELLDLLKPLDLSFTDFPDETGQADATLQHALERLFGALPATAGMRMENAAQASLRRAKRSSTFP